MLVGPWLFVHGGRVKLLKKFCELLPSAFAWFRFWGCFNVWLASGSLLAFVAGLIGWSRLVTDEEQIDDWDKVFLSFQ